MPSRESVVSEAPLFLCKLIPVIESKTVSVSMVIAEKSPVCAFASVTTLKPFCPKLCRFACDWFANVAICFLFLG